MDKGPEGPKVTPDKIKDPVILRRRDQRAAGQRSEDPTTRITDAAEERSELEALRLEEKLRQANQSIQKSQDYLTERGKALRESASGPPDPYLTRRGMRRRIRLVKTENPNPPTDPDNPPEPPSAA